MAMLASGNGSNVENFIHYFSEHPYIEVGLVVSNNPEALVLEKANRKGIPHILIRNEQWGNESFVKGIFSERDIDYVVLAGFLRLVPVFFIDIYPGKIVNIHPALLPKFGGKGMYGARVHQAVIQAKEKQSGITIHQVTEQYDEGPVLFQQSIPVDPEETPSTLAQKIQALEHHHFPVVVEQHIARLWNLPRQS